MPSGRRGVNRAQVRARNGAQGARRGGARGARHGDFADHVTRTAGQSEREASGALVGGQRMRGAAAGDRASGAVGACQHRSRWSRCGCWGGLLLLYCSVLCAACLSLSCRHVLCESAAGRGGAASCASHSQARARAVTAGGRRAGGRVGGRVDWLRRARGVRLAARGLRLAARGSRLAARGSRLAARRTQKPTKRRATPCSARDGGGGGA